MNILCFDTSLDKTYILISYGDKFLSKEIKSDEKNYHSAYLIPEIKKMCAELNMQLQTLDVIVTNCGPGSFTGIRAGLSVAKVMALELNLPVVGLNSCEILKKACGVLDAAVLLDARRLMYYFYDGDEIKLILKDEVEQKIKNCTVVCDSNVYKDFLDVQNAKLINYEEQNFELEKVMYELGLQKIKSSKNIKEDFSHNKLKANYIQTPPVFSKGN